MVIHGLIVLNLFLFADVEKKSTDKIRREIKDEARDVITRERQIATPKAKAYETLIREHVPYQVKIEIREDEKKGYSILAVTGKTKIVSSILVFINVLNGTVSDAETIMPRKEWRQSDSPSESLKSLFK